MNEPVRVWIIDRMLKESLANALYDPARDLAFEQERVDGAPEIVDDGIALDYDAAGIGIDLDLGDLAAGSFQKRRPNLHSRRQPKSQT
jgi:hypothetical protein